MKFVVLASALGLFFHRYCNSWVGFISVFENQLATCWPEFLVSINYILHLTR